MGDERRRENHSITLENRESVSVTGVSEVISFDEDSITAETELGLLIIKGEGLHVSRLDLDSGILSVDGSIDSLEYNDKGFTKAKGSIISRIFK